MQSAALDTAPFLFLYALAIVSPGPNLLLVIGRTLDDSRRTGLWTAFGVATGSGLFALAGLLGLILLFTALPHFDAAIRLVGGGFLAWTGMILLRGAFTAPRRAVPVRGGSTGLSPSAAWRLGLVTNLTNPKAWAFYVSLFTLVLRPGTPLGMKVFLNLAMFSISLVWYGTVALLVSHPAVQARLTRIQPVIQGGCGVALVLVGVRLVLAGG